MGVAKYGGQFHTYASEIVDVEEATVVDVVSGNPEIGDAPGLLLNQGIERRPISIQRGDATVERFVDGCTNAGALREICFQNRRTFGNLRSPLR